MKTGRVKGRGGRKGDEGEEEEEELGKYHTSAPHQRVTPHARAR